MEEYRAIYNSPNYEVSNFGNVRHKKTKKILKPKCDVINTNYTRYNVNIADIDGKQRNQKIHRLVAEAFLPKIEGKTEIDHIDRNPGNNHLSNLRWANRKENCMNTGIRSDNTSGERNISYMKNRKKWRVSTFPAGHLGVYETLEDAIVARDNFLATV